MRDLDLVAADRRPDTHVHGFVAVELCNHVGFFGAQLHIGDIRQAYDRTVTIGDDQVFELGRRAEIGVRQQADLYQVALGLPDGGEIVVAPQRREHVARRQVVGRQPVWIDPDAHRDRPAADDVGALHAGDRCELRLQRTRQPVGDRRDVTLLGRETQVEGRVGPVRALHLHLRWLGLRRKLGSHLLQARRHLGQGRGAVLIQLEMDRDGTDTRAARRLEIVDTADR